MEKAIPGPNQGNQRGKAQKEARKPVLIEGGGPIRMAGKEAHVPGRICPGLGTRAKSIEYGIGFRGKKQGKHESQALALLRKACGLKPTVFLKATLK